MKKEEHIELLFAKALSCRSCFKNRIAEPATIEMAQPRYIGPDYFTSHPRVVVVALNPGAGNSSAKMSKNQVFAKYIDDYKHHRITRDEYFTFQAKYMEEWGNPPGRFLRFYRDGIGLSLAETAMANIAWCADRNNGYPRAMLTTCFENFTAMLLDLLDPNVVLLSGVGPHAFAGKIKQRLPRAKILKTLHYAHRKGYNAEHEEFRRIRVLLQSERSEKQKAFKCEEFRNCRYDRENGQ
jgi:hypothetical protein